jgi:hypothetical protein
VVLIFAILITVTWESEQVVIEAADFHVTYFDGGMEDTYLDAHADRVAVLLVQQTTGLLDA